MAKSIPDQLSMFPLMTSEGSHSAISLPGSAGGPTPFASPGGQTTGLCGRARAPASRSRSQAKAPVQMTHGTCGPTSTASSPPADPLSSWESKLRERLGTGGSMEFELIWKELVTPGGQSIFRLSRSTPRTFASASTGSPSTWWTPKASQTMGRYSRVNGKIYPGLWMQAEGTVATTWAAFSVMNSGRTDKLSHAVFTATWPTPTKADGDGGHVMGTASATGKRENGTKIISTWPTPVANPDNKTPEAHLAMKLRMGERDGTHSNRTAITDLQVMAKAIGTTTSGSPDQTAKPGALNPAFPCWLMGFPEEFLWCAPEKTGPKKRTPTTE